MTLHPLAERLITQHGAQPITLQTLDDWLAHDGDQVLFFSGDPVRFGEVLDVAVVLPELRAAFRGRFDIGLIAREHEDTLAKRFGVQRWPSLVFVRDGAYLGTLAGMQDWDVYLDALRALLAREPGRRPAPTIAIRAAEGTGCR